MKVNFVAISGKIYDDNLEVYTKSGKKYKLYTIRSSLNSWIRVVSRDPINTSSEVIIFGKIINIYGNLAILAVEYKKSSISEKSY
ncbi:MAG: hypothetical protein RMJ37_00830 [Spirochaetia bacterium]|nr:hypothetical protein [Spirochaetota bacterium]MCX8097258.1 hypothetical protein [Spirochaetota bacterium]MDW8111866.1 hypothetical protein [Spirochaetia bacterium]